MKKLVILLLANLLLSLNANAQYKINKTKYNYQTYTHQVGDPYNPAVAFRNATGRRVYGRQPRRCVSHAARKQSTGDEV